MRNQEKWFHCQASWDWLCPTQGQPQSLLRDHPSSTLLPTPCHINTIQSLKRERGRQTETEKQGVILKVHKVQSQLRSWRGSGSYTCQNETKHTFLCTRFTAISSLSPFFSNMDYNCTSGSLLKKTNSSEKLSVTVSLFRRYKTLLRIVFCGSVHNVSS